MPSPKTEKEKLWAMLSVQLEPLVDAMLACQKAHQKNEADKRRRIELLNERAPYIILPENNPRRSKLVKLDEERHEIEKRIGDFPSRITKLAELEKHQRKNFAGV